MRILLIEDNAPKMEKVCNVLLEHDSQVSIVVAKSYSEACLGLTDGQWDFIIVDMSIPSFSNEKLGGRFGQFGGREVIRRIIRKSIKSRYIVLTQFAAFSDGGTSLSLEQLDHDFQEQDGEFYKGMVLFKFNDSTWQEQLIQIVWGENG